MENIPVALQVCCQELGCIGRKVAELQKAIPESMNNGASTVGAPALPFL
jgi:hypothetical protein